MQDKTTNKVSGSMPEPLPNSMPDPIHKSVPKTPDEVFSKDTQQNIVQDDEHVNCILYNRNSGKLVGKVALDDVKAQLAQHQDYFVWIYLLKPSDDVLHKIQQDFDLHDLAIEDTTMVLQRTKIEMYGDLLFVVFGTVSHIQQPEGIEFGSTNIFLGERFLISVRQGDMLCEKEVITLSIKQS